jgi:hypothetical protein
LYERERENESGERKEQESGDGREEGGGIENGLRDQLVEERGRGRWEGNRNPKFKN